MSLEMDDDGDERTALAEYRDSLVPPQQAQRNWQALVRRIEAGESVELPGPAFVSTSSGRAVRVGWMVAAAALLLAAGATFAPAWRADAPRTLARVAPEASAPPTEALAPGPEPSERPLVSQRTAHLPKPDAEAVLEVGHVFTQTFSSSVAGVSVSGQGPQAGLASGTSKTYVGRRSMSKPGIADEARLIGGARAALRDHNAPLALRLLDRHARQHARGVMAEERKALRVASLCLVGQEGAAKREARAFLRTHPNSPLSANVAKHCRDTNIVAEP